MSAKAATTTDTRLLLAIVAAIIALPTGAATTASDPPTKAGANGFQEATSALPTEAQMSDATTNQVAQNMSKI